MILINERLAVLDTDILQLNKPTNAEEIWLIVKAKMICYLLVAFIAHTMHMMKSLDK